jgi:hypothetical protein
MSLESPVSISGPSDLPTRRLVRLDRRIGRGSEEGTAVIDILVCLAVALAIPVSVWLAIRDHERR